MKDQETIREKAGYITSKDTIENVYPGLILAINSVRQNMETKIFYTFMGLNALKKDGIQRSKFYPPGLLGAIPGMPTLATSMMKSKIEKANIPNLPDLQEMAQVEGVEYIACHMTMTMMEWTERDLIDGCTIMTAEDFIKYGKECRILLFT